MRRARSHTPGSLQILGGITAATALACVVAIDASMDHAGFARSDRVIQYELTAFVIAVVGVQTMLTLRFVVATRASIPMSAFYLLWMARSGARNGKAMAGRPKNAGA